MPKPKPFTSCVFDIETTALEAVGAGMVLVAVAFGIAPPSMQYLQMRAWSRQGNKNPAG